MGANGGSTRVPGAKKMIFSKVVPRPLGMLKQVFLGRFEPVVARFGPLRIPKCLENGLFWDQKWVKNGSKTRFSKSDPGPFGMLKQVALAHFEPVATEFGSCKIPKCLESGPFWDPKWVKNGSKTRFSKSDPRPFGMLKPVFLAHFEPVLTEFRPFHHLYAPLCALRTYLGAVWWSHLELGEWCRLEDICIYIYIVIMIVVTTYHAVYWSYRASRTNRWFLPWSIPWVPGLPEVAHSMTEDSEDRGYRPTRLWGQRQLVSIIISNGDERWPVDSPGVRGKAWQSSSTSTSKHNS